MRIEQPNKRKDVTGQKFGNLTAIKFSHRQDDGKLMWQCDCDCGGKRDVWVSNLTRGKTGSCLECLQKRKTNLVGERFGRGVVIEESKSRRESNRMEWVLKCDCGNNYSATTVQLRGKISHRTRSCGCYAKSVGEERWNYNGLYGLTGTLWSTIKHGAKSRKLEFSITKEDAWNQWEKQNGICALSGMQLHFGDPTLGAAKRIVNRTASLDRIDNLIGYTKENIQWLHKEVNMMKHIHSTDRFLELCSRISNHNKEL